MSHNHDKVDPRVRRTQALILEAFSTLLQTKGFEDTTVSDIAQSATINRATFYAHFPDKHALLKHTISRGLEKDLRQVLTEEDLIDAPSLRKLVVFLCGFVSGNNERCQEASLAYRPLVEQEVRRYLSRVITRQLDRKSGEGGVATELAAEVLTAALYAAAGYWATHQAESPQLFADRVSPLLSPLLAV